MTLDYDKIIGAIDDAVRYTVTTWPDGSVDNSREVAEEVLEALQGELPSPVYTMGVMPDENLATIVRSSEVELYNELKNLRGGDD